MSASSRIALPSTVLDFFTRSPFRSSARQRSARLGEDPSVGNDAETDPDPELKLPDKPSLYIVLVGAQLLQLAFFILIPSSNEYAQHLGGTATFAGLVIGIPVAFSALALYPMTRLDGGRYAKPMHVAVATGVIGNMLYALGYRANYLYLILIGRIVTGLTFTYFMYSKRYLTDSRLVGIRRRTTLASWLVVGQGVGFSAGPFFGGLLYKIGFDNRVWNGYTAPAWITSAVWLLYWIVASLWFVDVDSPRSPSRENSDISLVPLPQSHNQISVDDKPNVSTEVLPATGQLTVDADNEEEEANRPLTWRQKATIVCMCWYAMTCFFILGGWESNIPVFTSSPSASSFNYSPYAAGNFIAVGGVATFPFLFLNVLYARRIQDRIILASGAFIGFVGLLIMLACVCTDTVNFGSFFVSWFLVALGFNLASTCTLSLLSKQLPGSWNGVISMIIQYANYTGRVTGAVWGGSGVKVGMKSYLGLQIAIVAIGMIMHSMLWKDLKAKIG